MTDKWEELAARMGRLLIKEGDLVEKFILGSGSGGQKINKTSSCVYLKHVPSGIEIKCQKTRSRDLNRLYARREFAKDSRNGSLKKKVPSKKKLKKSEDKNGVDLVNQKKK